MDNKSYIRDKFSKTAKQLGYRSRAALKLLEIHEKTSLFKPGMKVLDMGSAPGGWTQVAYNLIGKTGKIIGIDILPIETYKNVQFIQGDFNYDLPNIRFDVIISDICPNKTGNWFIDQCNMFNLCKEVVEIASKYLIKNQPNSGKFVCKFFNCEQEKEFNQFLLSHFKHVKKIKPVASRNCSSEFYYYCF